MRSAGPSTAEAEARAPRPDANRIALRAARSILEAASSAEIRLPGGAARVKVERLPSPAWPVRSALGLDEAIDGPWPGPVRLECTWEGGRCELVMSAATRRGRGKGQLGRVVGVRVASEVTDQSLLWISIPQAIRGGADGARVWVPSPLRVLDRRGRDALRGAARRSGLLIASDKHVEAFAVRLPEGEVLPLPGDAFARIAHLALLLLPFAAMTRAGLFEGEPPFDVDALPGEGLSRGESHHGESEKKSSEKKGGARLAKIYPLPGGAGKYKATLDTWLEWIGEARPSVLMFRDVVRESYGSGGGAAAEEALRLLSATSLASISSGAIELTDMGRGYRASPTPERLFEELRSSFAGLLEALVIAATPGLEGHAQRDRLLSALLERRWSTRSQARLRERWLSSMGLLERGDGEPSITAAGYRVLRANAEEVEEIRRRIEDLLEEEREADLARAEAAEVILEGTDTDTDTNTDTDTDTDTNTNTDTDTDTGTDAASDTKPPLPSGRGGRGRGDDALAEPPSKWSDRVTITAELIRPHLGDLRFPDALLQTAAAALSSGKHLLLVGPPGTGKTELALAIGAAARAEGYCREILPATASADWTTFDTIGGYAIQQGGAVRFRPGVFLRALERRAWLLIDELNRADIDRAFGELLTVLAGRSATTPFAQGDGRLVSIGPDPKCSHPVPPSFRLITTMNTWDKTSLFRLSFAALRRFAAVHVGAPDDSSFEAIMEGASLEDDEESGPPLDRRSMDVMKKLFRSTGVLALRPVGPAIAVDMIRYMRRRGAAGDGFVEAASMLLLPQLEGLDSPQSTRARDLILGAASAWASPSSIAELRARLREVFPLARGSDA